jgi:peptidyl-prolyl cis-trans isomerase A (cyclophilin A)
MMRSFSALLLLGLMAGGCKSTPESSSKVSGPEQATEQAPNLFKARFTTSKGDFVVEVHRDWAPHGADRFYNLVKIGFFDEARFFRVMKGFVVQWGIHADGDPVMSRWRNANIPDDPVKQSNVKGTLAFAMGGPGTRSTQVFASYGDNVKLDAMGFAPFGKIVQGMDVAESLYAGYGQTPEQPRIQREGNSYLAREFPELDYVKKATLVP